jgi:TPR repeat protein
MSLRSIILCALLALLPLTSWAGMTPEEVQAFDDARLKAGKGDAEAQSILGSCYFDGKGVSKDQVEGVKWFQKAAEQGDARAQGNLGLSYKFGRGVPKDEVESAKWYRKAAEQGYNTSQFALGLCYASGRGLQSDDQVEAYAWFNLSADTNELSQIALMMLEKKLSRSEVAAGQKRTKELQEMIAKNKPPVSTTPLPPTNQAGMTAGEVKKFNDNKLKAEKAKADADAQFNLGLCYAKGEGVLKDEAEAVKYYRKAAEQGHSRAQGNLGVCYAFGDGVLKDEIEAYAWFNLSSDTNEASFRGQSLLERGLPASAIEAGKKRSKELEALIEKNKAAAGTK